MKSLLSRGFTLVELVMVIVITGILAASLTIFLKPVIDSYVDTRRRAEMTDIADTALRRMAQDIRSAVPNSVRVHGDQCFELLPTISGGRYRLAPDTVWDKANPATPSAALDTSAKTSSFDVLSPLPNVNAIKEGDWVVIDNQNTGDVYAGNNRAALKLEAIPDASLGTARMVFASAQQFSVGYDGGRFVVVPNNGGKPAIVYVCEGTDNGNLDSQGNGKGTLYRVTRAFAPTLSACPATTGAAILATQVRSCTFIYDANQGATQQSGFVWMRIELSQANESVFLAYGVHVDNVP